MKRVVTWIGLLILAGCAGVDRGCSSWTAQSFGADWVVVQYAATGDPINCWKLVNTSVSNEHSSDGIYWKEASHVVHISGWYNRVQVSGGRFDEAAKLIGVNLSSCNNGKYMK